MVNMVKHCKGIKARPDWDTFFISFCFLIAQRSIDESTLCGSCIVSKDKRILSSGYNGPISGSDDSSVPQHRPDKYAHFIHAEENALLSFYGSPRDLDEATIYVTNRPCSKCLRMILQKGIHRIVYARNTAKCVDEEDIRHQQVMISNLNKPVEMIEMKPESLEGAAKLLARSMAYLSDFSPPTGGD